LRSYDNNRLQEFVEINLPKLANDRKYDFNVIIESVMNHQGRVFFLDAPGGTGKTFLINLLLAQIRSSGKVALAVASSDTAATLLYTLECTMSHRSHIEAIDRTVKDLKCNNKFMGSITFVFAGDFRQTLPLILKGTRADVVNASLKSSPIWNNV